MLKLNKDILKCIKTNYLNLIILKKNSGIFLVVGFDQLVQTTQIYKLSNYISEHPPQFLTVYIADNAPLDYDTTWAYKFMTGFKREFRKCGYSQINCYFTGRVRYLLQDNYIMFKNIVFRINYYWAKPCSLMI